jgi:hypothetical protein
MATRLLNYRGVPDDEIEEIRALLDANAISYYETPPSNWFISSGALWLDDDSQYEQAMQLYRDYQQQRRASARQRYSQLKASGSQPTLWQKLRDDPLTFAFYLAVVLLVLYLSIMPFLEFGE